MQIESLERIFFILHLIYSSKHNGLTTLANKSVSVMVLMALPGHSQIATTQQYINLRLSVVRAAVEMV
jgi:hypothetical protein